MVHWEDFGLVLVYSLGSLVWLFVLTKLMGNRQMSQLTLFDYIIGISIGSIAAEMASHPEEDAWLGLIAMTIYALVAVGFNVLNDKSLKARRVLIGSPLVLLDHGQLYRQNLKRAKLDLNELLAECRSAGYFDLSELEMILLEADVRELRANPNRMAKGVIIEAKLDKARGPLATVLLQNGTLHVGDNIVAGLASGRVRAMVNDKGERVKSAGPSMPVEISGFTDVPSAGDEMMAVEDDRLGRQVVEERRDKLKAARVASSTKVSLDNLFSRIDQSKMTTLNLIVKADVQGSVEAVKQALEKLSNDQVRVRVLHSAVGAVTKDDVNLASAFDAIIIGFNIRPDNNAKEAADREGVDIRLYRVIYQAIEDIEKAMKGLLAPEYKEVLLGHAEVRNTFRITGAGTVAGCYVQDGKMQRNAQVRLLRDNIVVYEGKLNSLKRFKDDAKEVAAGYECGISFDGYNDIKEGDIIECFIMEEIER